jgi:hypothetical protein
MLDDGIPRTLEGDAGPTGPQGIQGIQGVDGPQGPQGPMTVEAFISETATVTLPNSTTKQDIYIDVVNVSVTGPCFLDVSLAVRGHSTSSDMEFDIEFDGSVLDPQYVEEHKDSGTAQENWRSQCFDLGSVTNGNYTLTLRFSKESTGGTAQIKNYTAKLVRY